MWGLARCGRDSHNMADARAERPYIVRMAFEVKG